jgi:K+ transporter
MGTAFARWHLCLVKVLAIGAVSTVDVATLLTRRGSDRAPWRIRRGLRRHRHKPDLRVQRVAQGSWRRFGGGCGWRALLVFWAIVLVVAIKYVVFVMKADNEGEGGTMALLSLALPVAGALRTGLLIVGLAGASLFFGDAMITPAISVLSAVEGLGIASPPVTPYVVPIAALVLVCLFSIQSRGSGAVGFLFGPVMALWFTTLAVAGLIQLVHYPRVLLALSPNYALAYAGHVGAGTTFAVLGSVFLALTGGEALYADMGHFGRSAIRISWFAFVLPALVLVYLGQGALVLSDPGSADNPFFLLFPNWLLVPAVLLTTAATIASQAVLSGAFALVQQAIQLGAIPRLDVRQTSEESAGQVYVPQINWLLAALVLALVFGFRSSDALANAYGIAVAGDMLVTTLLVTTVAYGLWRWPAVLVFLSLVCSFYSTLLSSQPMFTKSPPGAGFRCSSVSLRSLLCSSGGKVGASPSSGGMRTLLIWQPSSPVLIKPARPSA